MPQLEEWELRELGPMLLPPEVMLQFGRRSESDNSSSNGLLRSKGGPSFVHVADLTRADMPPALFQPPPPLWEQQRLQKQQLSLSHSSFNGGSGRGNDSLPIRKKNYNEDFSLGATRSNIMGSKESERRGGEQQKYSRDPFSYWKKHRCDLGGAAMHAVDMEEVERRATTLENDFDDSEALLKELENIVSYEENVWGEGGEGGEGGSEEHQSGDADERHRSRYHRYDEATRQRDVLGGAGIDVNELEREVDEAKDLLSKIEELMGAVGEDDEDEEGSQGDENDEDEMLLERGSGRRSTQRRMRYKGEGEWVMKSISRDAPSPSRNSSVPRKRKISKRYRRVPATMTRRSYDVVVGGRRGKGTASGRNRAARRDSVGTRVHKGVEKLNHATGLHGRVTAALDLARNVV